MYCILNSVYVKFLTFASWFVEAVQGDLGLSNPEHGGPELGHGTGGRSTQFSRGTDIIFYKLSRTGKTSYAPFTQWLFSDQLSQPQHLGLSCLWAEQPVYCVCLQSTVPRDQPLHQVGSFITGLLCLFTIHCPTWPALTSGGFFYNRFIVFVYNPLSGVFA